MDSCECFDVSFEYVVKDTESGQNRNLKKHVYVRWNPENKPY